MDSSVISSERLNNLSSSKSQINLLAIEADNENSPSHTSKVDQSENFSEDSDSKIEEPLSSPIKDELD